MATYAEITNAAQASVNATANRYEKLIADLLPYVGLDAAFKNTLETLKPEEFKKQVAISVNPLGSVTNPEITAKLKGLYTDILNNVKLSDFAPLLARDGVELQSIAVAPTDTGDFFKRKGLDPANALGAIDIPNTPTISYPKVPVGYNENLNPEGIAAYIINTTGEIKIPELPPAPKPLTPQRPNLIQVDVQDNFSPVNIPQWNATLDANTLTAPNRQFDYTPAAYRDALISPVIDKLRQDLAAGGYGIEVADEMLLWMREREREDMASSQRIDEIKTSLAALGYRQPPGAMQAAILKATQDSQAKAASSSREIAIKRADLFNDTRKFTIQQAQQVERLLIELHNATEDRLLKAEQASVEMAIAVFNAAIQAYNLKLERYKTESQVFETRMRAVSAQIQVNQQVLEIAKTKGEVNKTLLDVYSADIAAVRDVYDAYKTQVEAAKVQSEIEVSKLEIARSKVDLFRVFNQAKESEFSMYKTQVDAERLKLDAYSSSISAVKLKFEAVESYNKAQEAAAQIDLAQKEQLLKGYLAKVDAVKARIAARQADTQAAYNMANIQMEGVKLQTTAYAEHARQQLEYAKAQSASIESDAKVKISNYATTMSAINTELGRQMQTHKIRLDSQAYLLGSYTGTLQAVSVAQS